MTRVSASDTASMAAHHEAALGAVGVIMPVYNRPAIALEAIDSIALQTRRPDRLIIVDDGSTDATAANIQHHLDTLGLDFDARLIRQSRRGVSAARNRAAETLEDCDVLAMLDSDDLWPPDYLERLTPPLLQQPAAVAAFCDQVFVNTQTGSRRYRDLTVYSEDTTRRMFLYGPPTPSCTMIRNRAFQKLGGYDQTLTCSEDYELNLRLSLEGRWVHVPGPVVHMRRASGTADVSAHHLTEVDDQRIATQRVVMLDRFARQRGGKRRMRARTWRQALGRQWLEQGEQWQRHDRPSEAAWCYRRAALIAPWLGRAWRRYGRTRWRTLPRQPRAGMAHTEAEV